ncbi:MAG: CHASE2 domain-containing protein [Pseudomonadota bacterium]
MRGGIACAFLIAVKVFDTTHDPFGLVSTTSNLSGALVSALISPFYGAPPFSERDDHSVGQDSIVVVLYDDAYLDANNGGQWPIPLEQHKTLIDRLAIAGAGAIFLDVYFTAHTAKRQEELVEFHDYLREANCPSDMSYAECHYDFRPYIVLAGIKENPWAMVEFAGGSSATRSKPPRTALVELTASDQEYLLKDDAGYWQERDDETSAKDLSTAALELFDLWGKIREPCIQPIGADAYAGVCVAEGPAYAVEDLISDTRISYEPGRECSCDILSNAKAAKMVLQWGYAPSEGMAAYYKKSSDVACKRPVGTLGQLAASGQLFLRQAARGMGNNDEPLCLYTTQLSALFALGVELEVLESIVRNNIVMIGTNLGVTDSMTESPVHGYVPSIFWHATALDNLIEHKDKFTRLGSGEGILYTEILCLVLALILFTWMSVRAQTVEGEMTCEADGCLPDARQWQLDKVYLLSGVIMVALLTLTICLFWIQQRIAPHNWVGVAALVLLINGRPLWSGFSISGQLACRVLDVNAITHMSEEGAPLAKLLAYFLILVLTVLMFVALWSAFFLLFALPIGYFAATPEASGMEYGIFFLLYALIAGLAFNLWTKGIKKCT